MHECWFGRVPSGRRWRDGEEKKEECEGVSGDKNSGRARKKNLYQGLCTSDCYLPVAWLGNK